MHKVDSHQYYDKASPSLWRITEASHQALGALIVVVVVLLLGRGNERLGWRR